MELAIVSSLKTRLCFEKGRPFIEALLQPSPPGTDGRVLLEK